jgi:hypothetical protein
MNISHYGHENSFATQSWVKQTPVGGQASLVLVANDPKATLQHLMLLRLP